MCQRSACTVLPYALAAGSLAEHVNTDLMSKKNKSWLKYLRQLPVCLFWNWFYLDVLPNVVYNPYNHAFPWFGIRWYHATGKCMQRKWRYSFLLGDVGALIFQDFDEDWRNGNGNPCVNLWNFQLEIQAFTLTTSVLCLPHGAMLATVAAIVAFGFNSTSPNVGAWWVHHARGVALQVLFLRLCGLPRSSVPAAARNLRWPGLLMVLVALALFGASRGQWLESLPGASSLNQFVGQHPLLVTGAWQAALAVGVAMLCEGCRARQTPGGRFLAILNRLAFGTNVAHPFVQFFVESHSSINDRVFSLFTWPSQLMLIFGLTTLTASFVFLFVQRPWALLLHDGAVSAAFAPALLAEWSGASKKKNGPFRRWQDVDPDVITGYNINNFDLP
ncbi:unnamed protein product [Symbiodinium sp. CCMP2456]|nr:unnamed protein product [Symbiodinium sp. CCMP2456]